MTPPPRPGGMLASQDAGRDLVTRDTSDMADG
jgi:hypothetical protein